MSEYRLDVINLDQPLLGYRDFLSCWVARRDGLTVVIDPGPSSSIEHLLGELKRLGVDQVDLVLTTHIHLDHSGGAARVLEEYEGARFYCHESGVEHVVAPDRLWQGSLKVLKEVAEVYGPPPPVPQERLASVEEVEARGVKVIYTPGHAIHHVSFQFEDVLFAGEAAGVHIPFADGRPYVRPATPPRFFLDVALESIDKLLALDPAPARIVFAHYGIEDNPVQWLRRARTQLVSWVGLIRTLRAVSEDDLQQRLFEELMHIDPLYGQGLFEELDEDLRAREEHFLGNTLEGMLGYIEKNPA